MVSRCFKCLIDVDAWPTFYESRLSSLVITASFIDSAPASPLSVTLPDCSLSFFVNEEEELESRDFKHMVYDENQSIEALFGLENLIVLRPKIRIARIPVPEAFISRRLLIPNGKLKRHGNDQVRMDGAGEGEGGSCFLGDIPTDQPFYHTYIEDTELGCLRGNGSFTSTEFLARLHVMTSWHRPDPLTGKTGAQAALDLLRSAGCLSITERRGFDGLLTSTRYPQINAAFRKIESRCHWSPLEHVRRPVTMTAEEKHAARRAAYLFPSSSTSPAPPEDRTYDCSKPGLPVLPLTVSSLRYIFDAGVPTQITLDHLLCNRPAPRLPDRITLPRGDHTSLTDDRIVLDQLFSLLQMDGSFQREYLTRLDASAQHVRMVCRVTHKENLIEALKEHYVQCRLVYLDSLDIIKDSLGPTTDPHEQAHNYFGHWPLVTADVLLRYLASAAPIDIPLHWKKCLTSFALLLLDLQRSRRLLQFSLDGLEQELSKELENEGCDGWDPEEFPDWLLIQVGLFCTRLCHC